MSPVEIVLAAWLAVNVLVVLAAMKWAASRRRAFRIETRRMVEAAEKHANAARRVKEPISSGRRRVSTT